MNAIGLKWRFLVVEDNEDIGRQLHEAIPNFVSSPDTAEAFVCKTFKEASSLLANERFDLLILDLRDDAFATATEDENPAGLETFEKLKKIRFMPVVFYTALANKVLSERNSFVRVVEKTEGLEKLKCEVNQIIKTNLPALIRKIDEIQRSYMWDFVDSHWKEFESPHEQVDLAYLLARRLALKLEKEARDIASNFITEDCQVPDIAKIHPMQIYIWPAIAENRMACDILRGKVEEETGFWMVLTPSCDFHQKKHVQNVLLAQCLPLTEASEFQNWRNNQFESGPLKELIGDKRRNTQSDRFKYLPGTSFLPDSIVDFQLLKAVPIEHISQLEVIASLDSPFAETVLARFSRYYGRLGTPDIDKDVVISRLQAANIRTDADPKDTMESTKTE